MRGVMGRRERRRLDAEIELLRDNIVLAGERGDKDSVRPLEEALHYLQSVEMAEEHDGLFISLQPSPAAHEVLELIRGPSQVRIAPIRKRRKPAKRSPSPGPPQGPGSGGA